MSKDFISDMTDRQVQDVCEEILRSGRWAHHSLVGLIIEKLQEWGCRIEINPELISSYIVSFGKGNEYRHFCEASLQITFLRTAQALGHWSPPKKVEETFYWRNKETGEIRKELTFYREIEWERFKISDLLGGGK